MKLKKRRNKQSISTPERLRAQRKGYKARHKAAGQCPDCPERLDVNRRTGRYYALGRRCRARKRITQARLMRARRGTVVWRAHR